MNVNQNHIAPSSLPTIMFVDMNSYFASCEQQVNYYLRNRPVAVCVYTSQFGCIISPSVEAKKRGVKTGMRLNEAMLICPELVPLETNPNRYREFHIKIMNVLSKYSDDVIPKSIDEAMINFSSYQLIYKDLTEVAKKIKQDIKKEVGDWMRCSIGLAPNSFLAKLASGLQKPDGLVVITPDNIDEVLKKLSLTDLPGIAKNSAIKLQLAGIETPLELRYASAQKLKNIYHGVVGLYWHYRLNFSEVDFTTSDYKSMQAMRHISKEQRRNVAILNDLLVSLCTTLEKRLVKQEVYCKDIVFFATYENDSSYKERIDCSNNPIQEGTKILKLIKNRMDLFEKENRCESVINENLTSIGISISGLIPGEAIQFDMFENNVQQHNLRKTVYDIKNKFGNESILKAVELQEEAAMKDAIGFGSIKHLY